jgi:hypothetical protein
MICHLLVFAEGGQSPRPHSVTEADSPPKGERKRRSADGSQCPVGGVDSESRNSGIVRHVDETTQRLGDNRIRRGSCWKR